jgi:hypothetical protein
VDAAAGSNIATDEDAFGRSAWTIAMCDYAIVEWEYRHAGTEPLNFLALDR